MIKLWNRWCGLCAVMLWIVAYPTIFCLVFIIKGKVVHPQHFFDYCFGVIMTGEFE
jgi:hypothetical protein